MFKLNLKQIQAFIPKWVIQYTKRYLKGKNTHLSPLIKFSELRNLLCRKSAGKAQIGNSKPHSRSSYDSSTQLLGFQYLQKCRIRLLPSPGLNFFIGCFLPASASTQGEGERGCSPKLRVLGPWEAIFRDATGLYIKLSFLLEEMSKQKGEMQKLNAILAFGENLFYY